MKKQKSPFRHPNPTFDEAFPEVAKAMDKLHENFEKIISGEISVKETEAINKEAAKALSEARQKMTLMRRTATLKRKSDTGK
jgi:ElaB/YqjD/DUF883 family membrane-anchored ribosome-binding protein